MPERRVFEGSELEEAIARAARELGVDESGLEYEVVEEVGEGTHDTVAAPVRIAVSLPHGREESSVSSLEREVGEFLESMISGAGLELTVDVEPEAEYVVLRMSGEDRDMVLQDRAELLEALQYLLNRIFSRRLDERRVLLDCDGFRARKEEELREIARRAAEKVLLAGEARELGLMNPYERRIVHLAVAAIEGVTTSSSGVGFLKRVKILPK